LIVFFDLIFLILITLFLMIKIGKPIYESQNYSIILKKQAIECKCDQLFFDWVTNLLVVF